jgi:hypothetical protein
MSFTKISDGRGKWQTQRLVGSTKNSRPLTGVLSGEMVSCQSFTLPSSANYAIRAATAYFNLRLILPQTEVGSQHPYSLTYNRTKGRPFPQMKIALTWYHSLLRNILANQVSAGTTFILSRAALRSRFLIARLRYCSS